MVYDSRPDRRVVVGVAHVAEVLAGHPEEIWETVRRDGFLTREQFDAYVEGKDKVFAFVLDGTRRVAPFPLSFGAPRTFRWLTADDPDLANVLARAGLTGDDFLRRADRNQW